MAQATIRTLPNLIIAGVSKCGTTSLYSYLNAHPHVCGSSIKETLFFIPRVYDAHAEISPLEKYTEYFSHCGDAPVVMEASAGYFHGGAALANVLKESLGEIQVVLIFREPVSRFVSYYRYMQAHQHLPTKMGMEEYLQKCLAVPVEQRHSPEYDVYGAVGGSYYDEYLQPWIETFGDKLKIVFLEDLKANQNAFLIDLGEWLGLDTQLFPFNEMVIENKSMGFRNANLQKIALTVNSVAETFWRNNPQLKKQLRVLYYKLNGAEFAKEIPEAVQTQLQALFKTHNERFAKMLLAAGYTNLPAWLR